MKAVAKEWLIAAHDDLQVIDHLSGDDGLTHMVAFHAQQAVEKGLKAIMEEYGLDFLKIHNLNRLFSACSSHIALDREEEDLVDLLDQLYIEARYPGEIGLLPDGKPSPEEAESFKCFAVKTYNQCHTILDDSTFEP